ncbi:MAG: PTS glucose transporter subunit IIA [Coriobacteriaceae bacterium]|nr:PTS glucose transporter subunit IIA [Coriobacteriaceae bacterium]
MCLPLLKQSCSHGWSTGYVSQGDQVAAGQPILSMDRSVIAEAGYKDCVVVAVSNSAEFADVEFAVKSEARVEAGSVVAKVTRK